MGRPGSSDSDRDAAAIVLESYLVRRTICWDETRAYGTLAIDLLKALAAAGPGAPAAPVLVATLGGLTTGPNRWPDDERFRTQWCRQKFYGSIRRSRVVMILQALEEHYQTVGTKGEPIVAFDFSRLEIEHVMPQQWEANYPLPNGENTRAEREQALHGIGNLTLVSGKLNPALSNSAWVDPRHGARGKRAALDEHARLQLNCRLVRGYPEVWNEGTIRQRSLELFEAARLIWPDAATLQPFA